MMKSWISGTDKMASFTSVWRSNKHNFLTSKKTSWYIKYIRSRKRQCLRDTVGIHQLLYGTKTNGLDEVSQEKCLEGKEGRGGYSAFRRQREIEDNK